MDPRILDQLVECTYEVRLRFTEPLLGSTPTSSIAAAYVRSQQLDKLVRELRQNGAGVTEARLSALEQVGAPVATADGEDDAGDTGPAVTGFLADDRGLFIMDYVLKGFLKGAQQALPFVRVGGKSKRADGTRAVVSPARDMQQLLWVFGTQGDKRKLYLMRDGQHITAPDRVYDRPLRAETPQGPRVAIAMSEVVDPPCELAARIVSLKGQRLTLEQLQLLFAYAEFQGFGQWRSAGFGRCEVEISQL